jgi:farnesol dehydrogenase
MIELHIRGRFPTILGKGREVGNYVYIDDVVDGHIKAMDRGEIGQRYILGGENSTLSNFFSLLSRLSGKKPPWIHVPPDLARLIAKIEENKAELLGRYPLITRGWVETFLRDWAFSNEKAVRELGCRFRGLKQGMQLTCDWLREKKLGG